MVHSTPPGAFRPAPPRDIYNANIQIRSQIHRRRGGYFAQGKRRGRANSIFFRPGAAPSGFRDLGLEKNTCCLKIK